MANDRTRRPADPFKAAEAAFKPAPKVELAAKRPAIPAAKELVSIKIDSDVLAHFQNDGPGWQDRINDVLRQAAGVGGGEIEPGKLNASNDG